MNLRYFIIIVICIKKFIIKVYNHVDFILISIDLTKDKWRATKCFNYIFKQAFSVCDRKVGLKSKQLQLFNIKNWHSKLDVIHEIMIGRLQINHTLALQEEILSRSYRFLGVLESWCLSIYRKSAIRDSIY